MRISKSKLAPAVSSVENCFPYFFPLIFVTSVAISAHTRMKAIGAQWV